MISSPFSCPISRGHTEAGAAASKAPLTNGAGALAQTYTFDSFEKQTASSGSLVNQFQYTGRESDSETGLYYYRARYYDASMGRFLNEDPVQFKGGIDFYSYVPKAQTILCPHHHSMFHCNRSRRVLKARRSWSSLLAREGQSIRLYRRC